MIDKDFELQAEKSLVIPANYFARYACLYLKFGKADQAWQAVEAELHEQTGCNRFLSLQSFQVAQSRYHSGARARAVVLKIET